MNKRIPLVLGLICVLLFLGGLNIYRQIVWQEPTDGVVWMEKDGRFVADQIAVNGPAYLAGIKNGDILFSINDLPVETEIDIVKSLWIAGAAGQKVKYQIGRPAEILSPSFFLSQKGPNLLYFYLTLIGLTTLVIAVVIFFSSRRTFAMPYLSFYLICLVLYSLYVFSPTGEMDGFDTLFFWLDKVALLAFPPLLLHFFLIFPQRKKAFKKRPSSLFFLYLPGIILLLATLVLHSPLTRRWDDGLVLSFHSPLEKLGMLQFLLFAIAALLSIVQSVRHPANLLVRRQLRWILSGLMIGFLPFLIFYAIPFCLGRNPSQFAELTVLPQAFIPLAFAYSVSRYKLMDFELLLKKAATLVFSYFFLACLYLILSSQTQVFSENKINVIVLGILAMVLGATLFTPLKKLISSLLDRFLYKRSYKYRKTLLIIGKEISRERNLEKLSHSLLELITNALSLKSLALFLPEPNDDSEFAIVSARGESKATAHTITFSPDFVAHLREKEYIAFDSPAERRGLVKGGEELAALGFYHFLPLKVEDKLIGCLGMGKKLDNTFLNREDWDLLTAISSPVALAIENASLYKQASVRALEFERLKDYSENIIESLTVGVAVLDQKGEVIGWNRVLEETFAQGKRQVLGRRFQDILGLQNFLALFPSDTQQDFRLLSEISLELPGGEKRIFDIAKTPLFDNRMVPYGTIVVFEDITEKIRLQQQLVTSEKLASIGLLSAGVAHEINTPLTGISSYVQMLQKKLTDSHYAQILEKIEAQTERVTRIIKNLLNFAHNPAESAFHKVSVADSLKEIISLIEYKLKAMNIQLEMELAPVKRIWGQGERLQQVFINIILNAIDAMPKGGILRIQAAQEGRNVIVKIADTGTGIRPQHLPHIFDPFFTTKGIGKGTGLGLSISYAIIKEHEGHVAVESEIDRGTCFTIFIPADLDLNKMGQKSSFVRN
ncbi:MAG: ATP-binding protein [Candidatus Aminicenantales bacterium]